MLEDRVNTHFSALNDLVKLTTRPDVGNIVLVMPWYGRGYGLHPDFDRQMVRETESLRKRGLCVLDATSLVKCTTRYGGLHMENTEHNRLQTIRFYSGAGALGYHLFCLRSCKGLMDVPEMRNAARNRWPTHFQKTRSRRELRSRCFCEFSTWAMHKIDNLYRVSVFCLRNHHPFSMVFA